MKKSPLLFGSILFLFLVHFTAAPAAAQKEEAAKEAALAWLAHIDGGNYDQSWDDAASAFQAAVTKEGWNDALTGIFAQLDTLVSHEFLGAQHMIDPPNTPKGEYVMMQFRTYFGPQATIETVTFMLEGEAWKAGGYFVKPE